MVQTESAVVITNKVLESLFKRHYAELVRYSFTIVKENEAAEDVVQKIFIRLWEKRNELDEIVNFRAYLFRSVYNSSINLWSARKKISNDESLINFSSSDQTDDEVLSQELQLQIQQALETLPEKCREVFELSRLEGLSYKEIAEQQQISIKTVENQMGKALKLMRNALSAYMPSFIVALLLQVKW